MMLVLYRGLSQVRFPGEAPSQNSAQAGCYAPRGLRFYVFPEYDPPPPSRARTLDTGSRHDRVDDMHDALQYRSRSPFPCSYASLQSSTRLPAPKMKAATFAVLPVLPLAIEFSLSCSVKLL